MNRRFLPLDRRVFLVRLAVVPRAVSQLARMTVGHVIIVVLLVGVHVVAVVGANLQGPLTTAITQFILR